MCRETILVLYTGGTIGMSDTADGLVPEPALVSDLERTIAADERLARFRCTVERVDPVIDSADAKPGFWLQLARQLWTSSDRFDGFVILHGTDTMAYTASALSFFLAGLDKPVILTGAQQPITRSGSDAADNLAGAVICAAQPLLREVGIFFGRELLRGNRARKWSSNAIDAFRSPRYPALGQRVGRRIVIDKNTLLSTQAKRRPMPTTDFCPPIGTLKLYPGISAELVHLAGRANTGGLVVEMYGAGTGPASERELLHVIERLTSGGTPVVGVSQCFSGELAPGLYATSRAFSEAGVINGRDLTPEAALCKLVYLRHQEIATGDIGRLMMENIVGEISGTSVSS